MDPHPSCGSKNDLVLLYDDIGTTLATQAFVTDTLNEKVIVERKVTEAKMKKPAANIMADRSILRRLHSSFQGSMDDHDGLVFLPSLYIDLQAHIAGLYAKVPQELGMICGKISKHLNKLDSLPQRKDSADLAFDDIRLSLDLLNKRSVFLSQEVDALLEGPPRRDMERKMDSPTEIHGSLNSKTSFRR